MRWRDRNQARPRSIGGLRFDILLRRAAGGEGSPYWKNFDKPVAAVAGALRGEVKSGQLLQV